MSRKWMSREEIAEIHEAIATKIANEVANETDYGVDNTDSWKHYLDHKKRATVIREIESVGRA